MRLILLPFMMLLTAAASPTSRPAEEKSPEMSEAKRVRHVKPPAGEVLDISIKRLGNFEYNASRGGKIPPDVLALSGCAIRTRGYMVPLDQADHITRFSVVPSLTACCFGQPPQIQHMIEVHLPANKAMAYTANVLLVEGTLKVEEKKEDGFLVSLFQVEAASVKLAR